ncbi:MAG: hypothetical protein WDW38_008695 [Sanguina aurantia]
MTNSGNDSTTRKTQHTYRHDSNAASPSLWLYLQTPHVISTGCISGSSSTGSSSSSSSVKQVSNRSSRSASTLTVAHSAAATPATTDVVPAAASSQAPPPKLKGAEIREAFLSFWEGRGHQRLPSASLVPEDPTVLLTIAGMLQFKPIFLGQAPVKFPRATTTQKCVRTNDIENVGVTARHHTFFEMLGNFSFGDYFKREAIFAAWELSTKVYGLPVERVWVSVFEEDEESLAIWRDEVGVNPARIKRMGAADNFWASGATGPCGPCSEMYYDFHPERGTAEGVSLEDDSRFIEYYNLVFMQLNRGADGALQPLAAKNIDTGMGLERMAQILQGVPNNYETDLIFPIVDRAAQLAGVSYHTADAATQTALKVIGDHTRAVTYLISDGVLPSNIGRGYIVRRLLRRVVMKGRLLGIKDVFTPAIAEVAVALSGACDPQVAKNAQRVYDELAREEAAFGATLERGQKLLGEVLSKASANGAVLQGKEAFTLYDTFGFPLELTQELAEQQGVTRIIFDGVPGQRLAFDVQDVTFAGGGVTLAGRLVMPKGGAIVPIAVLVHGSEHFSAREFYALQRQLPAEGIGVFVYDKRGTGGSSGPYSQNYLMLANDAIAAAREARRLAGRRSLVDIVLDSTPFYAESGGQCADQGVVMVAGEGGGARLLVSNVQKAAGGALFVHSAVLEEGDLRVGQQVTAEVDASLRRRITSHHTATHLLQSALKAVLGQDTCQQGSNVTIDRLRCAHSLASTGLAPANTICRGSCVVGDHTLLRLTDGREHLHAVPCSECRAQSALLRARVQDCRPPRTALPCRLPSRPLRASAATGNLARTAARSHRPLAGEAAEHRGVRLAAVEVWTPLPAPDHGPRRSRSTTAAVTRLRVQDTASCPIVSMELCGGTHVSNTAEVGAFKIVSESGIASGIRRIEAVAGPAAVEYLNSVDGIVRGLSGSLKVKSEEISLRVAALQGELKASEKALAELKSQLAVAKSQSLLSQAVTSPSGIRWLVAELPGVEGKALQEAALQLQASLADPCAVILAAELDGNASFVAAFSPAVVKGGLQAGKIVGVVAKVCGGGGGGKPNLAQAGGRQGRDATHRMVEHCPRLSVRIWMELTYALRARMISDMGM